MSALFASMEPKPLLRPSSGTWQAGRLQRKCACGGLGNSGCRCGGPLSDWQAAPAMHDFSHISVHADSDKPQMMPELACFGRVPEDAGDTGCDVSKGVPDIVIHAPSLCYRNCTERHEEVHRKDLAPCCKRAHSAWKSAKTEDKKIEVQDKMNHWVESNADWLQCRAYAESVRCADEFLVANCGSKKAESEPGTPEKDSPRRATDEVPVKTAGGPEEVPGEQTASRVADNATPKDQTEVSPERCCYTVKEYRRKSDLRRDAFCKEGKKGPKPCPF